MQAKEIESSADPLEKRCQKLVKGSKKYQEAIAQFTESQNAFADALEEFGGGTDEESMLLGEHPTALKVLARLNGVSSRSTWN